VTTPYDGPGAEREIAIEAEEGYDPLAPPAPWPSDETAPLPEDDDGDPPGPWPAIPRQVSRYLKGSERHVICTRQHEAFLAGPAAILVTGLALAIFGNVLAYWHATIVHVIWWAFLALAGWSLFKWAEWRAWWFVVTGDRIMVISGVIRQRVDMLPYSKLRDLSMSQSIPGRVLGYGTFHCSSIGTDGPDDIPRLPDPDHLYRAVCELVMPNRGTRGPRADA
jgi:hypothetical protein